MDIQNKSYLLYINPLTIILAAKSLILIICFVNHIDVAERGGIVTRFLIAFRVVPGKILQDVVSEIS
jgi:hypothetical protein